VGADGKNDHASSLLYRRENPQANKTQKDSADDIIWVQNSLPSIDHLTSSTSPDNVIKI